MAERVRRGLQVFLAVGAAAGVVALAINGAQAGERLGAALVWLDGLGFAGHVLFAALYLVASLAILPAGALEASVGFRYGPVWGVPVAALLSTGSATVAFLLGRTVLRGVVERWKARDARWAAMDGAVGADGLRFVLLLRMSPLVPYNVTSFLLGGTPVRLRDFVVGTGVGHLLPIAMFVYVGSTVGSALDLARGPTLPTWVSASILGATVVATIGLTRVLGRVFTARAPLEGAPPRPPA